MLPPWEHVEAADPPAGSVHVAAPPLQSCLAEGARPQWGSRAPSSSLLLFSTGQKIR